MSTALQESSLPKDVLLSPIVAFLGVVILAGFLPPHPLLREVSSMPRLLEQPPAQALQGRDSWSPLTHFPYLRVTHFRSIKGLEPVLGWKLALLVVGNCAVFPLREQTGEGSMAPRLGFKLSPQAQMGVCHWQWSRNVSRQAGTHLPGDLGLQVKERTCASLVCPVSVWLWVREAWDAGVDWVLRQSRRRAQS